MQLVRKDQNAVLLLNKVAMSAVGAVCLLASLSANAFSFDCSHVSTSSDKLTKLICSDPGLSKLNDDIRVADRSMSRDTKHDFCLDDSEWYGKLETCNSRLCMKKLYEARLKKLLNVESIGKQLGIPIYPCPTYFDIKAWPADPGQTIALILSTRGFYLVVENSADGKILRAREIHPGTTPIDRDSGPGLLTSVRLDTANYAIQKGGRAVGVRIGNEYSGNPGIDDETLSLYDPQDPQIPKILDMPVSWRWGETGTCGDACQSGGWTRTISIGKTSTKGYFDLIVTEKSTDNTPSKKYTLHFDGTKYPPPPTPPNPFY